MGSYDSAEVCELVGLFISFIYSFSLTTDLGESITKEKVIALREKVARWSTSFRCSGAKRHWEKMEEDLHALISLGQIKRVRKK